MPGQLYNLKSKYGNQDDLVSLTKATKEHGIIPIADIVINHRCVLVDLQHSCLQAALLTLAPGGRHSLCLAIASTAVQHRGSS